MGGFNIGQSYFNMMNDYNRHVGKMGDAMTGLGVVRSTVDATRGLISDKNNGTSTVDSLFNFAGNLTEGIGRSYMDGLQFKMQNMYMPFCMGYMGCMNTFSPWMFFNSMPYMNNMFNFDGMYGGLGGGCFYC